MPPIYFSPSHILSIISLCPNIPVCFAKGTKSSGAMVLIRGDKYQNVKTGGSYILKISKGNTILLQEENGEGQLLMSYKEFEEGYVKVRLPEERR
jgi:hypothetical protein